MPQALSGSAPVCDFITKSVVINFEMIGSISFSYCFTNY